MSILNNFDQRLVCAAPKRWSKYTTLGHLHVTITKRMFLVMHKNLGLCLYIFFWGHLLYLLIALQQSQNLKMNRFVTIVCCSNDQINDFTTSESFEMYFKQITISKNRVKLSREIEKIIQLVFYHKYY